VGKLVYVICDGLADVPVNGRTPLTEARKPAMDALAREGRCGLVYTVGKGIAPTSDVAHLALLGYDPALYHHGRGVFEAVGAGLKLKKGDVAFRANFGTVEEGMRIVDRRAGRLDDAGELAMALNGIKLAGAKLVFKSTVEHRGVLVLRAKGLSSAVGDTDPKVLAPLRKCEPNKRTDEALRTAAIVNEFMQKAHAMLKAHPFNRKRRASGLPPANVVLLRGASMYEKVETMKSRFGIRGACVAGGALYKGVAKYIGMDVLEVKGATGRADTNLKAKEKAALGALRTHDLVFVHVKATDSFGHDKNFDGKRKMIERVDAELIAPLMKAASKQKFCIALTGDHATNSATGEHAGEPVPAAVWCGEKGGDGIKFDEFSCQRGSMGEMLGLELFGKLLKLIKG